MPPTMRSRFARCVDRVARLLCRLGLHARAVPFLHTTAVIRGRWLGSCPRCGRLRWRRGTPPVRVHTLFLDRDLSTGSARYLHPRP